MNHLTSIDDVRDNHIDLFNLAYKMSLGQPRRSLIGKVIANLFYEPSTRTSSSFYSAMVKQGGNVIPINNVSYSSVSKGESLEDTILTMANYVDAIVLRSRTKGDAHKARWVSKVPIINAGDGNGEHPTQTLLDAYTIWSHFGDFFGLNIGFMGDLKYGRTVHSLSRFFRQYNVNMVEICPNYRSMGKHTRYETLKEVAKDLDVLYMTRLQLERGAEMDPNYKLTKEEVELFKPNMIVLHPFPRVDEIPKWFDKDSRAKYFEQIQNGLYIRMAILNYLLKNENDS